MIQAIDKKFYIDPIWFGQTDRYWIITSDLELHIQASGRKDDSRNRAKAVIDKWNFKLLPGKAFFKENDYFLGSEELLFSKVFPLQLIGLAPIPHQWKHVSTMPTSADLQNSWEIDFPIETVWQTCNKDSPFYSVRLGNYLNGSILGGDQDKVIKKLRKQFPGMIRMSLEAAKQVFGERVIVKRR